MHELLLISSIFILMTFTLWKWKKVLMVIIFLEILSSLILVLFFMFPSFFSSTLVFIFMFFVGEALILLASLFMALRNVGYVYSNMLFS